MRISQENYTASDYSVVVYGLPDDVKPSEVSSFFSVFGGVFHVTLCCENSRLLKILGKRLDLESMLDFYADREDTAFHKLLSKIFLLKIARKIGFFRSKKFVEDEIAKTQALVNVVQDEPFYSPPRSFVMFRSTAAASVCIRKWEGRPFLTKIYNSLFPCFGGPPKFRDHKLRVKRACEASEVNWENLTIGSTNKNLRSIVTNGLSLIIVVFSVLVFTLLQYVKYATDIVHFWYIRILLSVAASLIILAIDNILIFVVTRLSYLEGHHSISGREKGILMKLFPFLLLNKMSPAFAYGIQNVLILRKPWYYLFFVCEASEEWHGHVGHDFIILFIVQILFQNLKDFLFPLIFRIVKRLRAKTPTALMHAEQGSSIRFSVLYAWSLVLTAVAFSFSAGEPFLLLLAFIAQVVHYAILKFDLLRLCRKPVRFNNQMALLVEHLIPWMAMLHSVFTCMFYYAADGDVQRIVFIVSALNILVSMLFLAPWQFSLLLRNLRIIKDKEVMMKTKKKVFSAPSIDMVESLEIYTLPTERKKPQEGPRKLQMKTISRKGRKLLSTQPGQIPSGVTMLDVVEMNLKRTSVTPGEFVLQQFSAVPGPGPKPDVKKEMSRDLSEDTAEISAEHSVVADSGDVPTPSLPQKEPSHKDDEYKKGVIGPSELGNPLFAPAPTSFGGSDINDKRRLKSKRSKRIKLTDLKQEDDLFSSSDLITPPGSYVNPSPMSKVAGDVSSTNSLKLMKQQEEAYRVVKRMEPPRSLLPKQRDVTRTAASILIDDKKGANNVTERNIYNLYDR